MEKNSASGFRIDERVYFTMGFIAVVFFLMLLYSVKTTRPCEAVNIVFRDAELFANAPILLKAETKNAETYVWDFGDKTNLTMNSASVSHVYKLAGTYHVHLTVNGTCEQSANLTISDRPLSIFPDKDDLRPGFICKQTIKIDERLALTDTTHGGYSRQWFFDQREPSGDTGRKVYHMFETEGKKTIYLRVNGRNDIVAAKVITVIDPDEKQRKPISITKPRGTQISPFPLPPGPGYRIDTVQYPPVPAPAPPATKIAPDIQAEEMQNLLLEVVRGKKTAAWFSGYFCDKPDIPVTYDDAEMSFGEMCNRLREIKSVKKIDRLVVSLKKNKATNCLLSIQVVVVRPGIFKRMGNLFKSDK